MVESEEDKSPQINEHAPEAGKSTDSDMEAASEEVELARIEAVYR